MRDFIEPFARTLTPLLTAVMVGAYFLTLPLSLGAVSSGECETFRGSSLGNDPTQEVVFNLCRRGDRLEGVKSSEGAAGRSVYILEGEIIDDEKARMTITAVLDDKPSPGWITCSDDVFSLRWDSNLGALVGDYISAECEDHAFLQLTRIPEPSAGAYGGCSSH